MRGVLGFALLSLALVLSACQVADTRTPELRHDPETVIAETVRDALGSSLTSVTVTRDAQAPASWQIRAIVESVDSTQSVDRAAARVLAAAASSDASGLPIHFRVVSRSLVPGWSTKEWGQLRYEWECSAPGSLGTDVSLWRGEAEDPYPHNQCGCVYLSRIRGHWTGVESALLTSWASSATPVPVLRPEETGIADY